ncbi:MAG: alpha/beta hydrolase [Thermodesulfobacteriota bacterium]
MKKLSHCSFITLLVLMVIGLGFLSTPASAHYEMQFPAIRPMVFVHGYTGSAQQFEWQAMRFSSSGYPQEYLNAFEYDSPNYFTTAPLVLAALDARIDAILQQTGADKVELLGHSLGTFVSTAYLNSSPARAAKVAHYVALDGGSGASLPGGVPTLAIFGGFGLNPNGSITGAQNVVVPKAPHNETCTSPVSFAYMYKFFTGHDPESTAVLPDRDGHINLAGRAVLFPQNAGVAGALVEIYEVNGETGARKHRHPAASYPIDESGNFGPFRARAGDYYEINIARPGGNHHFYIEPRVRSDYFIRLNTSPVGQGLGALMTRNPDQTNLIITKNREWLGDQSDGFDDVLAINGINIVNAINAPRPHMLVAYFVYDLGSDHITNLTRPITDFPPLLYTTFLSAVDVYLRGATPPDATISIVEIPRGDCGSIHGINVPNWAIINQDGSFSESITVQINDYIPSRCNETWHAH